VAVQTTEAPGAKLFAPSGQVTVGNGPVPVKSVSAIVTLVIVTFPVLVTANR
jgi:hypothetical protein